MINFSVPINAVSFGQVSTAILREAYKANLECCIFPIGGQVDLSTQTPDERFNKWLENTIKESPKKCSRDNRTIKLWHIQSSLESFGKEQELLTFHETDQITDEEKNILKNQKIVWVTSKYTKSVFEEAGLTNVRYLPLGFDTHNFRKLNKKYYDPGITVIGVGGKFEEKRKAHTQTIRALLKNYGNNHKFMLHFAVFNVFLSKEQNDQVISYLTQGQKYTNVVWMPFIPTNAGYNDFLNSVDIWCATSVGEAYCLPTYQSAALGKKIVALNAHVYPDYLNNNNAWLFEPNGKQVCYDNMFFREGSPYSQGNFFSWRDEDFLAKLDEAIKSPMKEKFEFRTYKDVYEDLIKG
jgi:hypothetical protein